MAVSAILTGLTGGSPLFLLSWVLPAAIGVTVFSSLVFPGFQPGGAGAPLQFTAQTTLFLAFVSVVVGVFLSAVSTPLYRVLEGYLWPARMQDAGIRRQRSRKNRLVMKLAGREGWRKSLVEDRLRGFPADEKQIAPTALGNAIRSFETYGTDHFRLNSQILWSELYTVIPEALRKEVDQSRAGVDFFVALLFVAVGEAVLSFVALWIASGNHLALLQYAVVAGVSLLVVPLLYWCAVTAAAYWSLVIQAVVNMGRKALADALGLQIPESLLQERQMWGAVCDFVFEDYRPTIGTKFDAYRVKVPSGET